MSKNKKDKVGALISLVHGQASAPIFNDIEKCSKHRKFLSGPRLYGRSHLKELCCSAGSFVGGVGVVLENEQPAYVIQRAGYEFWATKIIVGSIVGFINSVEIKFV